MEEKGAGKESRGWHRRQMQEGWMINPNCDFRLTARC